MNVCSENWRKDMNIMNTQSRNLIDEADGSIVASTS